MGLSATIAKNFKLCCPKNLAHFQTWFFFKFVFDFHIVMLCSYMGIKHGKKCTEIFCWRSKMLVKKKIWIFLDLQDIDLLLFAEFFLLCTLYSDKKLYVYKLNADNNFAETQRGTEAKVGQKQDLGASVRRGICVDFPPSFSHILLFVRQTKLVRHVNRRIKVVLVVNPAKYLFHIKSEFT